MTNPEHNLDQPSPWVTRFARLIPQGEVLDLACGSGRHARLLSALRHDVLAVDRDHEALTKAAGFRITPLQIDLEKDGSESVAWPFEAGRFSGIVVTNYLHRPLMSNLLASLAPGGVLIYETFACGNEQFGKPSNPDFLLKRGELLDLVKADAGDSLRVIAFEDGYVEHPKPAIVQRICVVQGDLPFSGTSARLN